MSINYTGVPDGRIMLTKLVLTFFASSFVSRKNNVFNNLDNDNMTQVKNKNNENNYAQHFQKRCIHILFELILQTLNLV